MRNRLTAAGLSVSLLACVHAGLAQERLTRQDYLKVFSSADASGTSAVIDGMPYCEIWSNGFAPGEEHLLGYVFLRSVQVEGKQLHLLVGINENGAISKVAARDPEMVEDEFLAQFDGRTVNSSFECARTLEDLRFVPAMLKAMRGKQGASDLIAEEIQSTMISAQTLLKAGSVMAN